MIITRVSLVLAVGLLAGTAAAQSAKKPLNLNLSPADVTPAAAGSSSRAMTLASAATPDGQRSTLPPNIDPANRAAGDDAATANHTRAESGAGASSPPQPPAASDPPGVYYGDHSADLGEDDGPTNAPPCDDYTYNQPQVHGSISTGIVSGSHIGTGSYSGGVVSVSKAFGSCDHPGGGISISVGGTTSNGFGRRWGH